MLKKALILVVISILMTTLTFPIFFEIYRESIFNTVPHDDYAPYLLTLVGVNDKIPPSPFAYRIISVVVAIPFYHILPVYKFTNLPEVNIFYLKSVQALCFVSYISLIFTSVTIFLISRRIFFASKKCSLIVGLMVFLLYNFTGKLGVDLFAIFIISLLFLYIDNLIFFAPLILLSAGINEKISIIFSTILIFRCISSKVKQTKFIFNGQLFFSCMAIACYFIARHILDIPGNEHQTNPSFFLKNIYNMFSVSLSLKGFVLNILPVLILILIIFAIKSTKRNYFCSSDISALFILFILATIADVVYNIGRITMYSYPLYLPALSCFFDEILKEVSCKDDGMDIPLFWVKVNRK